MTATHAPQHPTSYVYAPPVMPCIVCDADTDPRQAAVVEVTRSGDLAVAVVICPACARRAVEQDGDLDALIADIRESYAHRPDPLAGARPARPAPAPAPAPTGPRTIYLPRRPVRTSGLRHPPHGRQLTDHPPEPDAVIQIAVDSRPAYDIMPEPKLAVWPEHQPDRMRYDVVAGRRVRVAHPATIRPARLQALVQALIDHGASLIELVDYPGTATHRPPMHIRPSPEASR